MMKKTENLMFRLEQLKKTFCLGVNLRGIEFATVEEVSVYAFVGWKEEEIEVKRFFGPNVKEIHITELWVKLAKHIGTEYLGVMRYELEHNLQRIEKDRELFKQIKNCLKDFNYEIKYKHE